MSPPTRTIAPPIRSRIDAHLEIHVVTGARGERAAQALALIVPQRAGRDDVRLEPPRGLVGEPLVLGLDRVEIDQTPLVDQVQQEIGDVARERQPRCRSSAARRGARRPGAAGGTPRRAARASTRTMRRRDAARRARHRSSRPHAPARTARVHNDGLQQSSASGVASRSGPGRVCSTREMNSSTEPIAVGRRHLLAQQTRGQLDREQGGLVAQLLASAAQLLVDGQSCRLLDACGARACVRQDVSRSASARSRLTRRMPSSSRSRSTRRRCHFA